MLVDRSVTFIVTLYCNKGVLFGQYLRCCLEIFSCIKNCTGINLVSFSLQFLDPLVVGKYLPKFEMSFR